MHNNHHKDYYSPILLTGFGKTNFGKQYRQGNRVYSSKAVAMAINASPVGNTGGYSYLYLVIRDMTTNNNHVSNISQDMDT